MIVSKEILESILKFREERDWKQFHTPRNLAASISIEASELLEIFQWARDDELREISQNRKEEIQEEIADVFIYLILLSHDLEINIESAIFGKLISNGDKYPIEYSKGRSEKYHRLPSSN